MILHHNLNSGYVEEEWVVGFFQVTTQNTLLFISCQGILSKFLYIKPNPYYRHFPALKFSEGFCTKIFDLTVVWICMVRCLQVTPQNFLLFSHLRGYFKNYHRSSQTHITVFFVHWGSYVNSPT